MTDHQPLYADLRHLRAWFKNTGPGAGRITYAALASPDPKHEVVRQVAAWRQAGEVATVQKRIDGKLFYLAERTRRGKGQPASIDQVMSETIEGRMFAMLDRAARQGTSCPSYTDLADELGLRDKQQAAHRFRKLVNQGLIRVQNVSGRRVVTIVATGASTASGVDAQ